MVDFDTGSNFISITAPNGRTISFACFDDGNHEVCFEDAGFRSGVAASKEEWEKFFDECHKLMEKF